MQSELQIARMVVAQLSWWSGKKATLMKPEWEISGSQLGLTSNDRRSLRGGISRSIRPKYVKLKEITKAKTIAGVIGLVVKKVRDTEITEAQKNALFERAIS